MWPTFFHFFYFLCNINKSWSSYRKWPQNSLGTIGFEIWPKLRPTDGRAVPTISRRSTVLPRWRVPRAIVHWIVIFWPILIKIAKAASERTTFKIQKDLNVYLPLFSCNSSLSGFFWDTRYSLSNFRFHRRPLGPSLGLWYTAGPGDLGTQK